MGITPKPPTNFLDVKVGIEAVFYYNYIFLKHKRQLLSSKRWGHETWYMKGGTKLLYCKNQANISNESGDIPRKMTKKELT